MYATELSAAALAVAEGNRQTLELANVSLLQGTWCEPLPVIALDLIVSNPPYLAEDDEHLGRGDVRFEPRSALVAADSGMQDFRNIAMQAPSRLRRGGWLLLEHGWQQGAAVRSLLQGTGFVQVATRRDAAGRERMTMGRKP